MTSIQQINNLPVALSIAGSDPSGGAGIQADIKTFSVIGVYCAAVITALTAQNTTGVSSYLPVPAEFVSRQIRAVLDDLNVTHIKIGMVANREIAQAIGETLATFSGEVIYDPVIKSSGGVSLFSAASTAVSECIISHTTVLTPNIAELEILSGGDCPDQMKALAAAKDLFRLAPRLKAVCVKGGHMNTQDTIISDFLVQKDQENESASHSDFHIDRIDHPRILSNNTHGTGCTFASALTAFHMLTGNLTEAFKQTCLFMDLLLSKSTTYSIGKGTGPLLHHCFTKEKKGDTVEGTTCTA